MVLQYTLSETNIASENLVVPRLLASLAAIFSETIFVSGRLHPLKINGWNNFHEALIFRWFFLLQNGWIFVRFHVDMYAKGV